MTKLCGDIVNERVLLLHLGKKGAGPAILEEMIKAHLRLGFEVDAVWSEFAENALPLGKLCPSGSQLATYRNRQQFILGIPRAAVNAIRSARKARRSQVSYVFATMENPWQWVFALAYRVWGVPYVLSLHDVELHSGEKSRVYNLYRGLERNLASGLVFYSDYSLGQYALLKRNDTVPRIAIPHGLISSNGSRSARIGRHELPEGKTLKIGVIGRVVAYKGLDKLPAILAAVRAGIPESRIEVWGTGDAGILDRLRGIDGIDLNEGWVPDSLLSNLVKEMDILLLPHDEATQSGLVPLAHANRVPVVVSPVGGLVEQVEYGRLGYVAGDVSAAAIGEAVRLAVESSSTAAMVEAAAGTVVPGGRRSWEISATRIHSVFGSEASESGSGDATE